MSLCVFLNKIDIRPHTITFYHNACYTSHSHHWPLHEFILFLLFVLLAFINNVINNYELVTQPQS